MTTKEAVPKLEQWFYYAQHDNLSEEAIDGIVSAIDATTAYKQAKTKAEKYFGTVHFTLKQFNKVS